MRLIDANGSFSINATDNTGYSLAFGGGIISCADEFGHIEAEFFADDIPTIDPAPAVRWIPVTERLPDYDVRVLVTDVRAGTHYVGIWTREKDPDDDCDCWFDSGGWWSAFDEVTHWVPLPKPPEVENAETE